MNRANLRWDPGFDAAGENVRRTIVESATAGSTEQHGVWLKVK
ncbi:MAG TPA: hypothetical protein VJB18_03420 [Burkholderiales bacterium]|nr:hypothetical protein [Burkholderiales bacterium]